MDTFNHVKKTIMLHTVNKRRISAWATLFIAMYALFGAGCLKTRMPKATASLDIIHTVAGVGKLLTNFADEGHNQFIYSSAILYNYYNISNNRYGSYVGETRIRLYEEPDTTDKSQPVFDLQLDLPEASINTLLLTGTRDDRESILIREELPYFQDTDSVMAIRFINCSPGSGPINIHLEGGEAIAGLSGYSFKERSAFITFPVLSTTRDYVFEARDAVTNDLLATYTTNGLNINEHGRFRYRSFSLILGGIAGATDVDKPAFIFLPHTK